MTSLYRNKGLIAGALVGNVMEFFDFIIYVYLSTYITKNFFPLKDSFVANILMFSVFASGYLTRPFGAMLFGYIGDKYGRKIALIQSIVLITLSTVSIGLLPVYADIGIYAPILLVACRLIQGFAVSGEQSGAAVYLSESLNANQKGFIGSIVLGSSYFGVLLGSLTCLVVSASFSVEQMEQYGWRIPFLLSFALGSLSLYFRTKSEESEAFKKIKIEKSISPTPVKETFKLYWKELIILIFLVMGLAVPIYMYTVYIPNYISITVGFEAKKSLIFSTLGLCFISFMVPFVGRWADRMGNEKMLLVGLMLSSILGYPIFSMFATGLAPYIMIGQLCLGITASFIAAPIFGVLLKMFPTRIRYTAISLVFNTSMALFGSTVPIVSMSIIKFFDDKASPGFYLSLSGLIGITALYFCYFRQFAIRTKISNGKMNSVHEKAVHI